MNVAFNFSFRLSRSEVEFHSDMTLIDLKMCLAWYPRLDAGASFLYPISNITVPLLLSPLSREMWVCPDWNSVSVQIKIIECVQDTGVAIFSEYVVSLCRYWQHFNFHLSCCRLWIWNKETVLQILPWVGNITTLEINISHIRYAAPCVASGTGEGASVGCQMMSLLIFYRLTQLFPDTQFKYLRWRRFKYQKQTRPC